MLNNKMIILDAGHGGVDDYCRYTSGNKKRFRHYGEFFSHGGQNDSDFLEGVFNRQICSRISKMLIDNDIPFMFTVENLGSEDLGLMKRIKKANKAQEYIDCIFISIHANAFNEKVKGFEVHYHRNSANGKIFAEDIKDSARDLGLFDFIPERSNKKSSRLAVLKYTKMTSVLVECGFFDNREEALLLDSEEVQKIISESIFLVCKKWFFK